MSIRATVNREIGIIQLFLTYRHQVERTLVLIPVAEFSYMNYIHHLSDYFFKMTVEAPLTYIEMDFNYSPDEDELHGANIPSIMDGAGSSTYAQMLSIQPWETIGKRPIVFEGVPENQEEHEALTDKLTAILEMRLAALVSSRNQVMGSLCMTLLSKDEIEAVLSSAVRSELRRYVARIGELYRSVHYHAYPHAAHVTLSVNKLLQMMLDSRDHHSSASNGPSEEMSTGSAAVTEERTSIKPMKKRRSITRRITLQHVYCPEKPLEQEKKLNDDQILYENLNKFSSLTSRTLSMRCSMVSSSSEEDDEGKYHVTAEDKIHIPPVVHSGAALFNRTFGLSVDPFSHFSLVFSALVHDVEHQVRL